MPVAGAGLHCPCRDDHGPGCGHCRWRHHHRVAADKVQHKIRLSGIDAPEKKQPFGNRSKESLSALAFDKTVNVETSKRDRYGRQIGKVLVNGRDVNLMQVERGMAWFYRQYQREQSPNDRRLYEAAEDAAKADKRGLWRDADPVPPWEFRHPNRNNQ